MSQQEDFTPRKATGDSKYEIHAIFPIAVYTKENLLREDELPVLETFKDTPLEKNAARADVYGDRSENTYILDHPSLLVLRDKLQACLTEYANEVLGFAGDFAITQSWLTIKRPGQQHQMHSHANSIISGVFYFGNEGEHSGLTFSKNAYVSSTWQMDPLLNPNISNQFSFTEIKLKVENFMVCMFPSYLAHKVDINETTSARYAIAFNAMPRYALGFEKDLTEMEFKRINREGK